jgi:hypothetical protein
MYAATLGVLADWVRALELPVALLQPRSTDAHETPLTVRIVRTALGARAVIAVGGGLEGYLPRCDALCRAKRPSARCSTTCAPPPTTCIFGWTWAMRGRVASRSCAGRRRTACWVSRSVRRGAGRNSFFGNWR